MPSDHFASGSRWKVTVFWSSETSQLSAIPGAGERSSGLKLTSRSQVIAQIVKSSSSWPMNGFSVCGSCAQPILRTFWASSPSLEVESSAPAGRATSATPSATVAAGSPPRSSCSSASSPVLSSWLVLRLGHRRLDHLEGLGGAVEPHASPRAASSPCACRARPARWRSPGSRAARSARRASPRSRAFDSGASGIVCDFRLTSVPKTKPAAPSSLPARIRWLSAVSTRYVLVVRSSTITTQPSVCTSYGVPMLAQSRVRQPPTSGASASALADRQHVGVLGVLEHAAERLRLEGAVEPLLGLARSARPSCG